MINDYPMIPASSVDKYQKVQLIEMYNEAVETIWDLQCRNKTLNEELDRWQEAYEEVSSKLFG